MVLNHWRAGVRTAVTALAASLALHAADNATSKLLQEIIRIDTSNPPGNEGRLDELIASKLKPLGFEIETYPTPVPGKTHLIARLRGDGSARPVLLAAHADVVGVEREKWSVDPFAGLEKDGYIYGRGAIDFKGGMAVFTRAVMQLAEKKIPLKRDVILMIEADEESAPYNTSWLAKDHWDKMDCEFALNEGGWIMTKPNGSVRYVSVSTADKSSISLVMTAKGTSTHSSLPRQDSAIFRLARALAKLGDYETKPMLTDSTKMFFTTLGRTADPSMAKYFFDLVDGKDPKKVAAADKAISEDTLLHAIMRNTVAPVLLNAGFRGNVIPGSADATINFRVVPGYTAADLIAEISRVINDPMVEIKAPAGAQLMNNSTRESTTETDLYRALVKSSGEVWPDVPVTPYLFQAGTDAGAWRSHNVPVYGIYPYPISNEDLSRMHGNDERVLVKSLEEGTNLVYNTILKVAAK